MVVIVVVGLVVATAIIHLEYSIVTIVIQLALLFVMVLIVVLLVIMIADHQINLIDHRIAFFDHQSHLYCNLLLLCYSFGNHRIQFIFDISIMEPSSVDSSFELRGSKIKDIIDRP